ncbi:MAG: hypothetical protein K6B70_00495 [Clostridia bacterium]|nr:hypothetical protein [Clostridia bacterium]
MTTKEKLDRKMNSIAIELTEQMRSILDFDDINEMQRFSQKFNVDFDTVQKLFSDVRTYKKDRKDYQIMSYLSKNSSSGVNLYNDVSKAKERFKNSEQVYKKDMNMIKLQSFISEIPASKVSIRVIDYLKENDANDNIVGNAINKYASAVQLGPDNNETVLKFLYENGYKPTNKNSVDFAYKYYSEGRKKDENIQKLETEMFDIEEVIRSNIKKMRALKMQLSYYEQTIPNMQSEIKEYAQRAQNSIFTVKQLQKQAEVKEHTGIFKRFFHKVTTFFKKDKPLLLSASLSGVQADMTAVSTGLARVGNTIIRPESQDNIIKLQEQKNLALGFKNMGEPIQSR